MAAVDGRLRHFNLHMERLCDGCRRLQMPEPDLAVIEAECMRVLEGLDTAVVKLLLTRGPGPRGYRRPENPTPTRLVSSSARATEAGAATRALKLRLCDTRLGLNSRLAGVKHLNRLEQVLACAEWRDPEIDEGLMFSADGRLVCATAANVFLLSEGRLLTPDIRDCGVAGVMRRVVITEAPSLGLEVIVRDLALSDLNSAAEVFITNAVGGVRPVGEIIGAGRWPVGEVTQRLRARVAAVLV
jgi:4-amino-4-deoxychorismate lyase